MTIWQVLKNLLTPRAIAKCRYCKQDTASITLTDNQAQVCCANCYAAGPAIEHPSIADARRIAVKYWNRAPRYI